MKYHNGTGWVDVVAPQGDKGPTGDQGPAGTGTPGNQGPQGPAGHGPPQCQSANMVFTTDGNGTFQYQGMEVWNVQNGDSTASHNWICNQWFNFNWLMPLGLFGAGPVNQSVRVSILMGGVL